MSKCNYKNFYGLWAFLGLPNMFCRIFYPHVSLSLIRTWGIHPLETHDIGEQWGNVYCHQIKTKWAITWRIGGLEAEALHPPAMAPRPLFFAPLLGFQVPPASGSHRSPAGRWNTRNASRDHAGATRYYPVSQKNHGKMDTTCCKIYRMVNINKQNRTIDKHGPWL